MRSDRYKEEPKPKKNKRSLRIILALILLLIVAIAAATAYLYKTAKDSISLTLTGNDISVDFGEKLKSMDYVTSAEGEVIPSAEYLDTGTIGQKEIVYKVVKPVLGGLLKPSGEYTLSYTVVDRIAPVIIHSGDGALLEKGTEFDINNVIAYGDNADPKPSLKVKGEVFMSKEGSYTLHVTVTDASGNKTEWDPTVKVISSLPEFQVSGERMEFADFAKTHKGKGRSFGIDVSEWQGDIDFEAVKKAGCEFVIIRVGYTKEDGLKYDSKFEQNFKNAKAAGLKVGLYMFSYDNSAEGVKAAANEIIKKLGGEKLDLPVAFDWEDFPLFQTYEMSFYDLNKLYDVFDEEMSKAGYDTMLYGSLIYLENYWTGKDTRPIWLAQYADKPSYEGKYAIWQAADTGRIAGIDGAVDLDILYSNAQ